MHAPMRGTRHGVGARWSTATRRAGLVVGALALAGGLLAACGGSSSGSTQSITLYSGQHEQTTDALVAGFEKATGITVNVRNDDEDTLANQIVTEGSHSPADVIYTENSPALEYLRTRACSRRSTPSTLAQTPEQVQLAAGRLGRRLGAGQRPDLQPEPDHARPAADVGAPAGRPRVQGQAGLRGRGDRLPADRHLGRPHLRRGGGAASGSRASRPTPPATSTPTTRRSPTRSTAARWPSGSSTSTTGTGCGPRSARRNMHSKIAYFAPHDPGLRARRLGRGHPEVEHPPGGGARSSWRSWSRRRARRSSPTRSASSTRSPRA